MVESVLELIVNGMRLLFGLIFVFFVPGYAVLLVLFPEREELSLVERIAFSGVFSVVVVVFTALLMDMGFGIGTTASNIFLSLVIFTLLMIVVWKLELFYIKRRKRGDE